MQQCMGKYIESKFSSAGPGSETEKDMKMKVNTSFKNLQINRPRLASPLETKVIKYCLKM